MLDAFSSFWALSAACSYEFMSVAIRLTSVSPLPKSARSMRVRARHLFSLNTVSLAPDPGIMLALTGHSVSVC